MVVPDAEDVIPAARVRARVVVREVAREDAPDVADATRGATAPAHPHAHEDAIVTARGHAHRARMDAIVTA